MPTFIKMINPGRSIYAAADHICSVCDYTTSGSSGTKSIVRTTDQQTYYTYETTDQFFDRLRGIYKNKPVVDGLHERVILIDDRVL